MPIDPRPPVGGQPMPTARAATERDSAAEGFDAALSAAMAGPAAGAPGSGGIESSASADPVDLRGLDGRDRTRQFVQRQPSRAVAGEGSWLFGEDGFGFDDLLDVVNPLQHIPIVSTIYRWITGDEISPAANMAGGILFGGPIGLAGAVANEVIDAATGRDLGEHAVAMMLGEEDGAADHGVANMASAPARVQGEPAEPLASPPAPDASAEAAPVETAPIDPTPGAPADPAEHVQLAATGPAPRFIPLQPVSPGGAAAPFIPVAVAASFPAPAAGGESGPADRPDGVSFETMIAEEMMLALDKYEALVRSRSATEPSGGPAAGSLFDGRI